MMGADLHPRAIPDPPHPDAVTSSGADPPQDRLRIAVKLELLARAHATLFPIEWAEPFGLVMIESMASGTPVVTRRLGAAPEVVLDGVTGFVCDTLDEMVAAVERTGDIDPRACRHRVEETFSATSMTDGYEAVYRQALDRRGACGRARPRGGGVA